MAERFETSLILRVSPDVEGVAGSVACSNVIALIAAPASWTRCCGASTAFSPIASVARRRRSVSCLSSLLLLACGSRVHDVLVDGMRAGPLAAYLVFL